MYIRSLPRARPAKRRKKRSGWIRSAILDYVAVPPTVRIGIYLLDTKRRETDRVVDYGDNPVELSPEASPADLEGAIRQYGSGWYRLVARNVRGRIVAHRDIEASHLPDGLDRTARRPRSTAERLKAELDGVRAELAASEVGRRRSKTRIAELESRLEARDRQIDALEAALDACQQKLERSRRLYGSARPPRAAPEPDDSPVQGVLGQVEAIARALGRVQRADEDGSPPG